MLALFLPVKLLSISFLSVHASATCIIMSVITLQEFRQGYFSVLPGDAGDSTWDLCMQSMSSITELYFLCMHVCMRIHKYSTVPKETDIRCCSEILLLSELTAEMKLTRDCFCFYCNTNPFQLHLLLEL